VPVDGLEDHDAGAGDEVGFVEDFFGVVRRVGVARAGGQVGPLVDPVLGCGGRRQHPAAGLTSGILVGLVQVSSRSWQRTSPASDRAHPWWRPSETSTQRVGVAVEHANSGAIRNGAASHIHRPGVIVRPS